MLTLEAAAKLLREELSEPALFDAGGTARARPKFFVALAWLAHGPLRARAQRAVDEGPGVSQSCGVTSARARAVRRIDPGARFDRAKCRTRGARMDARTDLRGAAMDLRDELAERGS